MKPLIFENAIDRIEKINTHYEYDFDQSLNLISLNNKRQAVIDLNSSNLSMITKTKVNVESDDFDMTMLDLQTITRVRQESNDEYNLFVWNNISTYVKKERDDESFNIIT